MNVIMKNNDVPWPLVKELVFKMSDGAIRANSENVEHFVFKNDRRYIAPVKEVFRRVINIGPDVFSAIIEKEVNNSPDKFNFKETEIDADTCRKIMHVLFQSFGMANPKIMVWWNRHKGAHELFKCLFNYGIDHVKDLLDAYEPGVSDIVLTKHKILSACLVKGKIPPLESLNISSGASSYSFGGLTIEDLSSALHFLGIPAANRNRLDEDSCISTESASTFHNLKKVQFLPDHRQSHFRMTVADVDKICRNTGVHMSSAEEVLDYILDICIQGLLQGDKDPLQNLRNAFCHQDVWLVCRNVIPETSQSHVVRIKACPHRFDDRINNVIDFKPRGYPSMAKQHATGIIRTIPKDNR